MTCKPNGLKRARTNQTNTYSLIILKIKQLAAINNVLQLLVNLVILDQGQKGPLALIFEIFSNRALFRK